MSEIWIRHDVLERSGLLDSNDTPKLVRPPKSRRYGTLRFFRTHSGSHIVVLPTCTVPLKSLVEENWSSSERRRNLGNVRFVRQISKYADGTQMKNVHGMPVDLYAKGAEHYFVLDEERVKSGAFWLGYKDTSSVEVNHPVVEEQAKWEARMLLSALRAGARMEVPQAIIIKPDGTRHLVTLGIKKQFRPTINFNRSYRRFQRKASPEDIAERLGMETVDNRPGNKIVGWRGSHRIDINRWMYPPFTDSYKAQLIKAILTEIKKIS